MAEAKEEVLYSLSETARMFGVSERTLHRWIRDGQFPVYRLGRQYRFRKSDLEAFLEEHREDPLVQAPLPFDAGRRDAFIERVKEYVEARVAHYEKRLAMAEQGGFFASLAGARTLSDDAFEEFTQFVDFTNRELADDWLNNPEVHEDVREHLGSHLAEVMQPLVDIVGRIGERAAELDDTMEGKAQAKQRLELVSKKIRNAA